VKLRGSGYFSVVDSRSGTGLKNRTDEVCELPSENFPHEAKAAQE